MKQEAKHGHSVKYEAKKERLLFAQYPESWSLECHWRQQSKGEKNPLIGRLELHQSSIESFHVG